MKVSTIKLYDILFELSYEEITNIVFKNDYNHTIKKSDIGIVLGGPSMIPHRINKVIELYNQKLIEKILVSGGIGFFNKDKKTPEAYKLEEYLFQNGIPKRDIIVEPYSKDTLDNIHFSLQLLEQYYDLDDLSLTLITSDFHLKRTLGLFSKIYPTAKIQWIGIKDGIHDREIWDKTKKSKLLIYKELIQLIRYAKKGYIEDFDVKVKKKQ